MRKAEAAVESVGVTTIWTGGGKAGVPSDEVVLDVDGSARVPDSTCLSRFPFFFLLGSVDVSSTPPSGRCLRLRSFLFSTVVSNGGTSDRGCSA